MRAHRDALLLQLKTAAIKLVAEDKVPLPSLPQAAIAALKVLRQEAFRNQDLVTALEPDVVLAARLVRMANSAARAGSVPVQTLGQAISRIGIRELETMVFEVAGEKVFASADPAINAAFRALWGHSLGTALIARDLARTVLENKDPVLPEAAYLGGLLHDIGKPVMAAFLLEAEERILGQRTIRWLDAEEWLDLVSDGHRAVGLLMGVKWDLPVLVRAAVANSNAYDCANPHHIGNVVCLANAICKRAGAFVGRQDPQGVEENIVQGTELLGIDPQWVESLGQGIIDRIGGRT